jgi:hypothetical protein
MKDFKTMTKRQIQDYLFYGEQIYDRPYTTPETRLEVETARAELESRMPKKDGKISPAQKKVMEFFHANKNADGELYSKDLEKQFNARTIENCIHKGLLQCKGKSRLRTDDMETVYWRVYVAVDPLTGLL